MNQLMLYYDSTQTPTTYSRTPTTAHVLAPSTKASQPKA